MKKILYIVCLLALPVYAQENDFRKQYEEFRQQSRQEYLSFREKANQAYADFMRQAWENYHVLPAVPRPQDEPPISPVPFIEEDNLPPIEEKPIPVVEVIPTIPTSPQPKPVEPIREQPQPVELDYRFNFFQTECKVRLGEQHRFELNRCNADELAEQWERLSESDYDNVIRDCLELRLRHQLCDWAYLLMLNTLSESFLGEGSNEATLLCAFLYCQSGYQMRLGLKNNRLYLLFASRHLIYDTGYWQIDGMAYYPLDCKEEQLEICGASFPDEKPLSLLIPQEQLLADKLSPPRKLQSKRYEAVNAEVSVNENLLRFFDTYPVSILGDNVCTKWAAYANTPLSRQVKDELYPSLQAAIKDVSQVDAVNRLLNLVQTAFEYEYDDKVWGRDRAFFAEESLYYPYCDCEDRSILFSRLVRDLLGLKVLLVYYPGHLATAVCFTEEVQGDHIRLAGEKYIVCDPTYIGAPIGKTMPDMDNETAKVILLQ